MCTRLYKCDKYFDTEKIIFWYGKDRWLKKTQVGFILRWHCSILASNLYKSLRGLKISWNEYVEALCANFKGKNDPLKDFRQINYIKKYI